MVSRTTRLLYKSLPQNKVNSAGPERKDKEFKVILGCAVCFRSAWTSKTLNSKQASTHTWCVFIDMEIYGDGYSYEMTGKLSKENQEFKAPQKV